MAVDVIVPFRPDSPERSVSWAHLSELWHDCFPHWRVRVGLLSKYEGAWCKAEAIRRALMHSTADTLVISDADVWCSKIDEVVYAVQHGVARWGIPHDQVYRLSRGASETVLRWSADPRRNIQEEESYQRPCELVPWLDGLSLDEPPYRGVDGGGMVVISRELYDMAPMDDRFKGWGQEDQSAGLAWKTLGGEPYRASGKLVHFWHPPQVRSTRAVGSQANYNLWRRYRKAYRNPQAMIDLIREDPHS